MAPLAVANRSRLGPGAREGDEKQGIARRPLGRHQGCSSADTAVPSLPRAAYELASFRRRCCVVRGLEVAFVLSDGVAARATGADARAFAWLLRDAGLDRRRLRRGSPGLHRRARCRGFLPARAAGAGGDAFGGVCPRPGRRCVPVAGTLAFYFDVTGKKEAALIRLVVKAFYGEREVVLESPADSAEEPELRPASSPGLPRPGFGRCGCGRGRAVLRRVRARLPLRQTELAGDLLYGGLVQFRARRRGVYHAGVRSAHRGAAAAGVIGPFPAGEPHSDGCARERSFRR